VEIAGLADKTVVVLVPESGDEIQNIKSGLMEIAQAFVVNKADREGADVFANNLNKLLHQQHQQIPVFKTVADKKMGIEELCHFLTRSSIVDQERRTYLLAEKAFKIIQHRRMKPIDKKKLREEIGEALRAEGFNLYQFLSRWD
jgi:LAO/AO transport system kinase